MGLTNLVVGPPETLHTSFPLVTRAVSSVGADTYFVMSGAVPNRSPTKARCISPLVPLDDRMFLMKVTAVQDVIEGVWQ